MKYQSSLFDEAIVEAASEPTYQPLESNPQLDGLRKFDAAAWKRYNYNDPREREVMEKILASQWPKTNGKR